MKQLLILAFSFLFSVGVAHSKAALNQTAPDFTLKDSFGQSVKLSDFRGKTVVLEWTNDRCPFVKKHYDSGNMQRLQKKYTEEGIVWLSLISSAPGKQGHVDATEANRLTKTRKARPTHVLFDETGTTGRSYGAKTTPHMYIIDSKGTLKYAGAIDSIHSANPKDVDKANNYIDSALQELMAGKDISTPVSKPYGCSIKYQ